MSISLQYIVNSNNSLYNTNYLLKVKNIYNRQTIFIKQKQKKICGQNKYYIHALIEGLGKSIDSVILLQTKLELKLLLFIYSFVFIILIIDTLKRRPRRQ